MAKNKIRKKVKDLSAEEFFSQGFDSDVVSDGDSPDESNGKAVKESKVTKQDKGDKLHHKDALSKLEEKDPEFYKFLKENDQELLEFDESEDSAEEGSGDEGSDDDAAEGDEEDENMEKDEDALKEEEFIREGETITLEMLAKLKKGLEKNSLCSLRKTMRIFHAAVAEASDDKERQSAAKLKYKIAGSSVFNGLVQICLKSVSTVLNHYLATEKKQKKGKKAHLPSTSVYWSKIKVTIKCYLQDLLQLLRQLTEPSMLAVILRHVQDLCLYYACFPKISKMLVKRLVRMWSSAEEHVRVLAFLCIRKLAIIIPQLFDFMLKQLYVGFVKNAKFLTAKTKPVIVFMENSLVEMFSMDHSLTYQYGFIYIRQMAIHLRTAISLKKKDSYQSVYNWQYISCIHLWSRVLGELHDDALAPLIYPLVQVTLGVIRLIPTARYYPLRFHCLHSLTVLAKSTDTYIPIASHLLQILESAEFNKKSKPSTAATPDLSCVLKFPKSQLHTRGFQDAVVENICNLMLEHFVIHSTSIALPELVFPVCLRMKRFMKKTEVPKFSKQIKQIVDKLQEAAHEVSNKRSSVNFSPKDVDEVKKWETAYGQQKNSLQKFYDTWLKMREIAKASADQMNNNDMEDGEEDSSDEDQPKKKRRKPEQGNEDDEDKKNKKSSVAEKKKTNRFEQFAIDQLDEEDVVEDFHMSSDED